MPAKKSMDVVNSDDAASADCDPKETASGSKKARASDTSDPAPEAASSKGKKAKAAKSAVKWQDVELETIDGEVPIYDDCNDIRRKIRALQKTPDFKVTHWLKEIGGVNNNSYGRFMKASGPTGGAENRTYVAAYEYFEKVRIAEGKKKTAKRIKAEEERSSGLPLRDNRRGVWVIAGK